MDKFEFALNNVPKVASIAAPKSVDHLVPEGPKSSEHQLSDSVVPVIPVASSDKKSITTQDDSIKFSSKVAEALELKASLHNENHTRKVNLSELKDVYCRGAMLSSNNPLNKSKGQWAMARVNMFLNITTGKNIKSAGGEGGSEIDASHTTEWTVDISEQWTPSKENFIQADEDIKKYDLNYDFKDIEDLYLENYKPLDVEWS